MADSPKLENLEEIVSRYGLQRGKLEEQYVLDIIHKIATILNEDWKTVGNYLGLSSEELTAIESWEYANKTEHICKVAVIKTWHHKEATCWKLANALYQHGRQDLVESLCEAIAEKIPGSCMPDSNNNDDNFTLWLMHQYIIRVPKI